MEPNFNQLYRIINLKYALLLIIPVAVILSFAGLSIHEIGNIKTALTSPYPVNTNNNIVNKIDFDELRKKQDHIVEMTELLQNKLVVQEKKLSELHDTFFVISDKLNKTPDYFNTLKYEDSLLSYLSVLRPCYEKYLINNDLVKKNDSLKNEISFLLKYHNITEILETFDSLRHQKHVIDTTIANSFYQQLNVKHVNVFGNTILTKRNFDILVNKYNNQLNQVIELNNIYEKYENQLDSLFRIDTLLNKLR